MEINCPFCNQIEPKSRILRESDTSLIVLSNPALVRGHCLVIPKRHIERLSELEESELYDLMNQTITMQELLLTKFNGCDIRQNYRPFQKQNRLKLNHLHIHLQPREFEDNLYQRCQFNETGLFKELSSEELDKIKSYILA